MKTVLLDIDDTLFDFHACAKAAILKSAEKYNVCFSEEMFKEYFIQNNFLWGQYEKGIIEREDIFRIRFPQLFEKYEINADGRAFEDAFQEFFKYECIFVAGAQELLDYLKEKYDLYVVSNSMESTQTSRLKKAKLYDYFQKIFVSDKVGHQKPTKEFFEYCFKNIENFAPEETIIIGDSLSSDVLGGSQVGIKTCWFNLKQKSNDKNIPCDYEVTSLEEIKDIL